MWLIYFKAKYWYMRFVAGGWLHLTFHIFGWFKLLQSGEDLSETEGGGELIWTTENVNFSSRTTQKVQIHQVCETFLKLTPLSSFSIYKFSRNSQPRWHTIVWINVFDTNCRWFKIQHGPFDTVAFHNTMKCVNYTIWNLSCFGKM